MRIASRFLLAISVATMSAAAVLVCASLANEDGVRVTVGEPATVRLSEKNEPSSTGAGGRRIVVVVDAFEPSPAGPIAVVVTMQCGDATEEIGRFGVFPNAAFTSSSRVEPQRFGFDMPDNLACPRPKNVTLRLEPSLGDGSGASMTARASLE